MNSINQIKNRGHILLIDDDDAFRTKTAEYIESLNFKVLQAKSGILGIKTLESQKIDLVFLDLVMPVMGGIECLSRIRKQFPKTFCVIMAKRLDEMAHIQCVKVGAHSFLEKPVDLGYLKSVLDRYASMIK